MVKRKQKHRYIHYLAHKWGGVFHEYVHTARAGAQAIHALRPHMSKSQYPCSPWSLISSCSVRQFQIVSLCASEIYPPIIFEGAKNRALATREIFSNEKEFRNFDDRSTLLSEGVLFGFGNYELIRV